MFRKCKIMSLVHKVNESAVPVIDLGDIGHIEAAIIDLVKQRPFLYDRKNAHFRNRKKKVNTWKVIGHEMKMDTLECRRIWQRLRERFAREKRAFPNGGGNWIFNEAMQFMDPFVRSRNRYSYVGRLIREQPSKKSIEQTASSDDAAFWNNVTFDDPPKRISTTRPKCTLTDATNSTCRKWHIPEEPREVGISKEEDNVTLLSKMVANSIRGSSTLRTAKLEYAYFLLMKCSDEKLRRVIDLLK